MKTEKKELAAIWSWPLLILAFIGGAIYRICVLIVGLFSKDSKK